MDRLGDVLTKMGMSFEKPSPEAAVSLAASLGLELTPEQALSHKSDMDTQAAVNAACARCTGLEKCESPLGRGTTSRLLVDGGVSLRLSWCSKHLAAEKNRRLAALVTASEVPEMLREMSFKGYDTGDNRAAVEAVRRLVKDTTGKGVVLTGPPGVGKTHLGMALVNNRLILGQAALYVTAPQLFKSIVASYDSGKYNDLMDRLTTVDLLMLDDLGVEKTTDNRQEELFLIINSRVNSGRQMVVTTNLSSADIGERYGARILSRLMVSCDWFDIKGVDRRIAKK